MYSILISLKHDESATLMPIVSEPPCSSSSCSCIIEPELFRCGLLGTRVQSQSKASASTQRLEIMLKLDYYDFSGLLSYAVLHINKGGLAVRTHRCPLLRRLNRIT